jgi:glycosyltransferase involved in cell wall biosynthesis
MVKIVGFDAKRIVCNGTGLGSYARTLINDMIRCDAQKQLLLYTPYKGRDEFRNQIIKSPLVNFIYPDGKKCKLSRDIWRSKGVVKQLVKDNVQIYHGLSGEVPLGLRKSGIKGIVTIHDLIFLRHPEYYKFFDRKIYEWKFRKTLKETEYIIAISECTKRDILEFGDFDPDKIFVIYQSCNPRFGQEIHEQEMQDVINRYKLPSRFILCVGTIEERKNLMLAAKSLKLIPDDIHLVAVGRQTKYAKKVIAEANRLGVSNRLHLLSGVTDNELNAIYKKAEVFVYPSRYEGFGIPIIEAIFSGLPVVACSGSCLEEAGGPDCIYVKPDDVEGMANAVMQMINNEDDRNERILRSQEYVQKFRGTNVASQVFDLYEKLNSL